MRRAVRATRGFTLLELLIAMSLTGAIMALLYNGFNLGIESWDRGQARADRMSEIRLAQDFLRRQLRRSVTVYRNDTREGRLLYFKGEADRVGWVAPMLQYLDLGGLYYMELDWVAGGSADAGGWLRLRWHPYNPADEDDQIEAEGVDHTVLLTGVSEFSIGYFGPGENFDDDPEWRDSWEHPQLRPSLIRIRAELVDLSWPELSVAVLN